MVEGKELESNILQRLQKNVCVICWRVSTPAVGRNKLWHENINLTLPEGAKARMDAVLEDGEDRLDLIRTAIERELKRRECANEKADVGRR